MHAFFQALLSSSQFVPHGHCYLWQPQLVGLHVVADGLIAIAYYSIPITLLYFVQQRQDLPFNKVFLLFSAFIVTCGTTHLMAIWTLWHPVYWLSGALKLATAVISLYTAVVLVTLLPQALALPGLAATNQRLQAEIAERQKTDAALRESEERLRLALAAANQGIYDVNVQTGEVIVSPSYITMLGYDPTEFQESVTGAIERIHPDDRARAAQLYQDYIAGKVSEYRSEFRQMTRDGGWKWMLSLGQIVAWDEAGQPLRMLGTHTDISDRKQAESALAQLAAIVESSADAILSKTLDSVIVSWNAGAERLFGYTATEAIGQSIFMLIPPEIQHEEASILATVRRGELVNNYETVRRHKNGQLLDVSLTVSPINDATGKIIGISKIARDISDRKQAEAERLQAERLRTELKLLEDILEIILAGYWDWTIPTNQAYLSPTLKRMFGYADEALPSIPQTWQALTFAEDLPDVWERFEQHVNSHGQIPFYNEVRCHHQDGSTVWVVVSGRVIEWDAAGNPLRMIGCHMDITERKQAEAQIQSSTAELQNLTDRLTLAVKSGAIGIWDWNVTENILIWDDGMYQLYGLIPDQFTRVYAAWVNSLHPDDRLMTETAIQQALTGEQDYEPEFRVIHPDGTIRFIKAYALVQRNAQGEPQRMTGINFDITARKQAEIALRESEHRFATLAATAPVAIFRFDTASNCIYVNDRWGEMTGRPTAEAMGRGWVETIHPEDRDRIAAEITHWSQTCTAGELHRNEARILQPDGRVTWYFCQMLPETDVNGVVIGYVGILADMTDRKRAEEALANYAREFEDLYNNAPCGYHSLNAEGRFVNVNDTELRWLGYDRAEMMGRPFADFLTEASRTVFVQSYPEFIQQGWLKDLELDLVCRDGMLLPTLINTTLVTNEDGAYRCSRSTLFDMRDRKRAEAQLRLSSERISLANAELARAARLKDEFLAGMSHELRTPLNAVLGLSEALLEEVYGDLTPLQRNSLQTIEKSGQHLLALINDILDLSKIESGKLELELTPVSVRSLCESSIAFVKQQANHKQIKISCQIDETLTGLQADERRLRQALINLLGNAVKFTLDHGRVTLQVRGDPQREIVEFSIVDTGIGIAHEHMDRLFQPFVQLDSSLSRRYDGTGLGLALVRRIMELHGGSIALESEVGKGSRFTIVLPWQIPTDLTAETTADSGSSALPPPDIERALIVEDSETAADQLSRYLTEAGIQITVHPYGNGAVEAAIRHQPDVILLDILLPDQTGWEVLNALKAHPATRTIPVVMVSVIDARSHGLKLGAAEYLVKPVTRQQLQHTINQVVAAAQSVLQTALVLIDTPPVVPPLILLAEDNEANITTTTLYLQAHGLQVEVARNGIEAIQMAYEYRPDLMLMDIQMPEIDGLEAIRRIRSDTELSQVPIIALTALAMPGDRDRCLSAGANEYMTKPVSLKQLLTLISTYVSVSRTGV